MYRMKWNLRQNSSVWLTARLIMAGILLFTAVFKISDIDGFINTVIAFGFVPIGLSRFVGWAVPFVELYVSCAMILGVFVRPTQVFVIPTMAGMALITQSACLGSLIKVPLPVSLTLDLIILLCSLI